VPFRVYPLSECDGEYDLVTLRGDRLYLGARPADGNLCSEGKRPLELAENALVRKR
jgi:hypothetical protein